MIFIPLAKLEKFNYIVGAVINLNNIKYLLYTSMLSNKLIMLNDPYYYTDSNTPSVTLK